MGLANGVNQAIESSDVRSIKPCSVIFNAAAKFYESSAQVWGASMFVYVWPKSQSTHLHALQQKYNDCKAECFAVCVYSPPRERPL